MSYKVEYEWWSDFHRCWISDFLCNNSAGFSLEMAEYVASRMRESSVCVTRNVQIVEM